MSGVVLVRNRQRECRINARLLRGIVHSLLQDRLGLSQFHLGVHLVGEPEMVRLNEAHLRHAGSTDVITFDYGSSAKQGDLAGEIFICVPEAVTQARRFRVTWQAEIVRYAVHGALHLLGYDDQTAAARRGMKSRENSLLKQLQSDFTLGKLGRRLGEIPGRNEKALRRKRKSSVRSAMYIVRRNRKQAQAP